MIDNSSVIDFSEFKNLSIENKKFQLLVKYSFDRIFAFILLILLFPLFVFIGFFIVLDDGFPVFFIQERVGLNGKTFKMFKFRTFKVKQENKDIHTYRDDPRITRVGKILRELSLDELPQLFNILLGQMSFIGPRPILPFQYQELDDIVKQRTLVKPGVTGLAQINGRNSIPWTKRFYFDLLYIKNYSLFLDCYIMFKTVILVLKREGVWEN